MLLGGFVDPLLGLRLMDGGDELQGGGCVLVELLGAAEHHGPIAFDFAGA